MQTLSVGFSPCPNDTFMFDAMIHQKIDTEGLSFEPSLMDVEQLNLKAFQGEFDLTKLSYHAYAYCMEHYQLMSSGSALGSGVGPLLIAKKPLSADEIHAARIAIPGKYTTANFLLSLAYPEATNKVELLFSEIEQAVINGDCDAGLIIHENRFTYQEKGLIKLMDLGEFWERESGDLIPLGGIVCRRSFSQDLKEKLNRVLNRSISYAFSQPEASREFVSKHAQEMSEKVIQQHIELYVNQYSLDLGKEGRKAVEHLYQLAQEKGLVKHLDKAIFIE